MTETTTLRRARLAAALAGILCAGAALAQGLPGPGPKGPPPLPSAEEIATIPSLSASQQTELRKILAERADALEAVHEKARAALDAQRKRDRAEAERIETQSSERIRGLLGDDGYRRYAEWDLARHGHGRGPLGPPGDDPHGRGPGGHGGPEDGGKPGGGAPGP